MKSSKLAAAVAMGLALGFGQVALAQKNMDNVKAMDANKDGMVSKEEFMRKVGEMFDKMDTKKASRLTPQDVQKSIDEIARIYGTAS
jgi:hypothetical protein